MDDDNTTLLRWKLETQQRFIEGLWGFNLSNLPLEASRSLKDSLLSFVGELDTATRGPTDVELLQFEAKARKTYAEMLLIKIEAIEQAFRDQRNTL